MDLSFYFDPLIKSWDRTLGRLRKVGWRGYSTLAVVAWLFNISIGLDLIVQQIISFYVGLNIQELVVYMEQFDLERVTLERIQLFLVNNAMPITLVLLALAVLYMVVAWVRARAHFILLHDVVHATTQVREPWRRYAREANGLFAFLLALVLLQAVSQLLVLAISIIALIGMADTHEPLLVYLAGGIVAFGIQVAMLLFFAYIRTLTISFVVPLMVKFGLGVLGGWGYFRRIFAVNMWRFLIYGVVHLLLFIGSRTLLMVVSLMAGIAFLGLAHPLQIPWLCGWLLLPVFYFFRCFSLEFLAQFNESYALLDDLDNQVPELAAASQQPEQPQ